jgi:hypothetical protein
VEFVFYGAARPEFPSVLRFSSWPRAAGLSFVLASIFPRGTVVAQTSFPRS